ncbi:MAG: hypothetical protein Q7J35_10755 [Candidatus Methanoperedens sp.]|nr:hypothetical protein [Candidatus Methanoperedens sp.]
MVKSEAYIREILNSASVFIEESKLPFSTIASKRLKIQVPNDSGITAEEYMTVITRPLEV